MDTHTGQSLAEYMRGAPPHVQAQYRAVEALAWRMVNARGYVHPSVTVAAIMAAILAADVRMRHYPEPWKERVSDSLIAWISDRIGWDDATMDVIVDGFEPAAVDWHASDWGPGPDDLDRRLIAAADAEVPDDQADDD